VAHVPLAIEDSREGAILALRVKPSAPRAALLGPHGDGALKVSVRAAPERGKANEEVCDLLAASLGLRRAAVAVVRGGAARTKRVLFRGVGAGDLRARLARALGTEES
jgi:uncharacterized protein YggU (UPF0235/DUF167 family)